MDPLSITASVIAVLNLTSSVIGYINDITHATREQKEVIAELGHLHSLLTNLHLRVEDARSDEPWFNQVKLLAVERGPLDQCKDILEKMLNQMPSSRRGQIKSALMFTFTKAEVENALKRMERLKSLIQCALTGDVFALSQAIHAGVETLTTRVDQLHIQLQTHADQELRHRLVQWLGVPDPSTNYYAALEKRNPKTGLWLVKGSQFNDWKSSECSLMWLYGDAGCGKTVLSATALEAILQHMESQSDTTVCFFYFDFNDIEKQSSRKAIRSLLLQLAQQVPNGLQSLDQIYQKYAKGQQQPPDETVHSLLQDMMHHSQSKYIILDALDECTDRDNLLTLISNLANLRLQGLRVIATSRREPDIEEQLRLRADYSINIESATVDQDIRVYVQDRLMTDLNLKMWSPSVQDEITSMIMEKANGMFRWVYCQLESIRECIRLKALRDTLSSLPETLDSTYERTLQGLKSKGHLPDAITALQWLCYSNSPLQVSELAEVLAIDSSGFSPEQRLRKPADIMVVCSSLVSCYASGDRDYIRLAHFSVKEYLLSDRCGFCQKFAAKACHQLIAESCLHYLLYLSKQAPLTKEVVGQYPLAQYTAKQWWQHGQKLEATESSAISGLALKLLTINSTAFLSWVQLYNVDKPWKGVDLLLTFNNVPQPLYYAASVGIAGLVEGILQQNIDINAQGGEYGNALQAASYSGYEKIVQILLKAGAEVNAQGGEYGNALQAASYSGHEKIVQMLLEAGAEVNAQGGKYGNALQAASYRGDEKIVQMLLEAGAEVNAQGGKYYNSALQAASRWGSEKVVELLLEAGAEVNVQGGFYDNALYAASLQGNEKVVQLLLEAGAEANAQGRKYGNALQASSSMLASFEPQSASKLTL